MSTLWAERLWTGVGGIRAGVLLEIDGDRIRALTDAAQPPAGSVVLRGLTLPGLVNAHSHAFHRALRGRTQTERGSFWTWRERMYAVAGRLTPENYEGLARGVFAEMLLAGITTVGEFHYVHHASDGTPYPEPTAMAEALARAAAAVGIRMTLLDTCYLAGGFAEAGHLPLAPNQARFGDGTAAAWAARASRSRDRLTSDTLRVGAAVHSVRAVPAAELAIVADWARGHDAPLHAHVSEQPAENADCVRVTGRTPVALLAEHGVLGARTTAVHATHLAEVDLDLLGLTGTGVCFCVTTERDLADGIGPAAALLDRGVPLSLGSDSHAVVDLFEEARGVELGERVLSRRRGHVDSAALLGAATVGGAASLGWDDLGTLMPGALADLVTVSLDSVRMAGWSDDALLEAVVFGATAADVRTVVVGGALVVDDGVHVRIPDVAGKLHDAIRAVTSEEARA